MDVDAVADDTGNGGNGRPNSGAIVKYLYFSNDGPTGDSFVPTVHVISRKAFPLEVTALVQIELH